MENKVFICNLKEIKIRNYIIKWIDKWNDEVIVFINKEKKIKIKSSICPHFGGEIIYNKKNNRLNCLWHNWNFCPDSGKCLTFPIKGRLNPYDFKVSPKPLKNYKSITSEEKIYAIKR